MFLACHQSTLLQVIARVFSQFIKAFPWDITIACSLKLIIAHTVCLVKYTIIFVVICLIVD